MKLKLLQTELPTPSSVEARFPAMTPFKNPGKHGR